jgi:hypothetical protein
METPMATYENWGWDVSEDGLEIYILGSEMPVTVLDDAMIEDMVEELVEDLNTYEHSKDPEDLQKWIALRGQLRTLVNEINKRIEP